MKTAATVSSIAALLLAVLFMCTPSVAFAQGYVDEISFPTASRITLTDLDAPRNDIPGHGGSSRGPNAEKWFMIEWSFDVTPQQDKKFVDEVTFRVSVEGREFLDLQDRDGDPVVLTGEVSYMLLQAGREQYGCMFIPPQVVAKFGGEAALKRSTTNVTVEAVINGRPVGGLSKNPATRGADPTEWMKGLKVIPKFIFTKDKSPWISAGSSRYPLQKLDTGR
ncbi:hypothetical protein DB346_11150 [Verrucomicrobia bacterium LW23]|nr:hypothetical protein DB346_11150 [Verrucomicrobia bacterium LW23]